MSQYLIEQLDGKANIEVQLRSEIHAVHGDTHLTAVEVRTKAMRFAATSPAVFSFLLAPMRKRSGCRKISRAMREAMC
jgi:hypothetical protein